MKSVIFMRPPPGTKGGRRSMTSHRDFKMGRDSPVMRLQRRRMVGVLRLLWYRYCNECGSSLVGYAGICL
jgi:hypothetical protein